MIAWFAKNGVAANLMMFAIMITGLGTLYMGNIPVEVFPALEINQLSIQVPYRGGTPEEVEESVLTRIEEAIIDVEGIEKIVAIASESGANVSVEIADGYDRRDVLDDVKNRVDAISTFPVEAERPRISLAQGWRSVINVVLFGDLSERDLKELGKQIRDDIGNLPEVSAADLQGTRPYEIAIEIDESNLQRYRLTFDQVAQALRSSSIDVPAGTLKTDSGQVVLRTKARAYTGAEFEDIVILTAEDGTRVKLGDIAKVTDGFDESPLLARFNGRRCVLIMVSREGNQNAITISEKVKDYMAVRSSTLPPGVELSYWTDSAKIVKGRLDTLVDSASKSLLLVFLVLTLFLRPSLALWVVIGIPVCFLGAISLMPFLGVTINIMSLFGFILVLGVVVDDAIVTGENIYTKQKLGLSPEEASIQGAREVALPVIFGILTTVLAFVPLLFGTGFHGKAQAHIALIVIPVLMFSLIESKLILPSHLSHSLRHIVKGIAGFFMPKALVRLCSRGYGVFSRFQMKVAGGLEWFVRNVYQPVLSVALVYRYVTIAIFLAGFAIVYAMIMSGVVRYVSFPRVQSERATATLSMQEGTPYEVTKGHIDRIQSIAADMKEEYRDDDGSYVIRDILSAVGGQGVASTRRASSSGQEHLGEVSFYVVAPEDRASTITSSDFANEWRKRIGPILGAKELNFRAVIGRGGDPIDIELTGPTLESLTEVSGKIKAHLSEYPTLFDISDSVDETNNEIRLKIRPSAENFGLTEAALARQVRQAFYGDEIQRIQRGRDEIRVMLRYPEQRRKTLASLEGMRIRTPDGQEVPFTAVAEAINGKSFPRIQRIDRHRAINVRADADKDKADIPTITASITEFLDELLLGYSGVSYSFEGEAREARENGNTTKIGGILLIFGIYTMLAIPFRSYVQPLIVMSVIPFGLVGAVLGHMIHGLSLSMLSFFGMLALAGVVVNDSLVLVDFINRRCREGVKTLDAAFEGGGARFRAIILTSFTTFAGLYPLITLKSTQAQFLIPMAVSLGYGVLFATFITLFLVPINYLILDDIKKLFRMASPEPDQRPVVGAVKSAEA
ncbi:MAG: efflux RND transporter permease subunit [Verrucomicrobiales bacterium]